MKVGNECDGQGLAVGKQLLHSCRWLCRLPESISRRPLVGTLDGAPSTVGLGAIWVGPGDILP